MPVINVSETTKILFNNLKLEEQAKKKEKISDEDFEKMVLEKFEGKKK